MSKDPNSDKSKVTKWLETEYSKGFFNQEIHEGELIRIIMGIKGWNVTPSFIKRYMVEVYVKTGRLDLSGNIFCRKGG